MRQLTKSPCAQPCPWTKKWPASLRAEPILDLAIDGHCAGRKRARRERAKARECSGAACQFHRSIPLVINADNKSAMKKSNRDWRNDLQAAPESASRGSDGLHDNSSHVRVTGARIDCFAV